jgi:hypothetical protein
MNGPFFSSFASKYFRNASALILVATFAMTPLKADFKDDIEYTKLKNEYGSGLPSGSGVKMTQVEYMRGGYWAASATGELAGKSLTYVTNTFGGYSSHANEVGAYLGGNVTSITPGVTGWSGFEATNYCGSQCLKIGQSSAPIVATADVENHSWAGNDINFCVETLKRMDYRIERDNVIALVGMDNGASTTFSHMLANAYNVIAVGTSTGDHPHSGSTLEVLGRQKPDLVGTATWTSYATPIVASCATLLVDEIKRTSSLAEARHPLVIKALLMAGATKEEFPGWSHTSAQPLDAIYGAGEVNIYNSYKMLLAGRQQASSASQLNISGWDTSQTTTVTKKLYYINVPTGKTLQLSAVLAWYRHVQPDSGWYTLVSVVNNLNLTLWNADSSYNLLSKVTESLSTIDNVEHIYEKTLAPGVYALEVVAPVSGEKYGLAWRGVYSDGTTSVNVAPSITTQPTSQSVTVGSSVTLSAAASGTPTPSYQWYKNGAAISGATGASYTIASTSLSAAATYTMVATNSVSSATSNGATLSVNAVSVTPPPTSSAGWKYFRFDLKSIVSSNIFQISELRLQLQGSDVTWPAGTTTVALNASYRPGCSSEGADKMIDGDVGSKYCDINFIGDTSILITVGGGQTLTADAVRLANANDTASNSSRIPTSWILYGSNDSVTWTQLQNTSNYTPTTTSNFAWLGSFGFNASSTPTTPPAIVTVAPSITAQPVSQTVTVGSSVTLSAAASGTPTPSYQWYKNGAAISGATGASYTIASTSLSAAATYTMVATNSVSSATSNGATLSVNAVSVTPPPTSSAGWKYFRFDLKSIVSSNIFQISELRLQLQGSDVTWPAGTTTVALNASYRPGCSSEGADKMIDGDVGSKYCDINFIGDTSILITVGGGQTLTADAVRLANANDTASNSSRIPTSWILYGSNDSVTWTQLQNTSNYTPTTTSNFAWLGSFAFNATSSLASAAPSMVAIADSGFESPSVGTDNLLAYAYNPIGSAWTFTGSSGLAGNNSGLTDQNAKAPEGTQVAFLRGASAAFSQTLSFSTAGTCTMVLSAARQGGSSNQTLQVVNVYLDGNQIGTFTPSDTDYQTFTLSFNVTTGPRVLSFRGVTNADATAFIDDIVIIGP